ncbi:MAG: hypothetical protein RMI94_03260 [Bryobacterales bacterium]|nr:hypothetical protein [Bryobacteraceae bacterium]MDW8129541.1 hypothetical protein [Bryobacterales bacterium]
MPDWKRLAAARGLGASDEDLARIAPVLDPLHALLCRLTAELPLLTEPLVTFRCEPEEEGR